MRNLAITLLTMIAGFSSGAYADNFIDHCLGMAGVDYRVSYQATCQAKTTDDGALLSQIGLDSQFQVDFSQARTDGYENVTVPVAGRFLSKKNLKLKCSVDYQGIWKLSGFAVEINNSYNNPIEAAVDCR